MNFISNLLSGITSTLGHVISALLLLVVAFVVASIVKSLIIKLVKKTNLSSLLAKYADKGSSSENATDYIGKLAYLLVFLLFVPGIFSLLGVSSVTAPLTNLLNIIWSYIPNIVAAIIIIVVGFKVAKLVRQLLVPTFAKLNVDALQDKLGIKVEGSDKLSNTLAYIVYVLILIPIIITALNVLQISAISVPAVNMLNKIFAFIPNIVVAIVIIIVGCYIGKFASQIVTRLIASAGFDGKVNALLDGKYKNFLLSKAVGGVLYGVVVIFFVVEAFNVLNLTVITNIGATIIAYMPYALSAILILAVSFILSSVVEKALVKNGLTTYAVIAKCAILTIGGFMILNQLGIATAIVNSAFIIILTALAVAFAIAFGVGGRDFAKKTLDKLEKKCDEK